MGVRHASPAGSPDRPRKKPGYFVPLKVTVYAIVWLHPVKFPDPVTVSVVPFNVPLPLVTLWTTEVHVPRVVGGHEKAPMAKFVADVAVAGRPEPSSQNWPRVRAFVPLEVIGSVAAAVWLCPFAVTVVLPFHVPTKFGA